MDGWGPFRSLSGRAARAEFWTGLWPLWPLGTRVEQGPQRAGSKQGLAGRAPGPSIADHPALPAAETGAGGGSWLSS